MSIEWFRDLVICILGLGAAVAIALITVLAFLIYRKVRPLLASISATTKTVEDISSCVAEEIVRPLAQVSTFVQGLNQAICLVKRFSK